MICDFIVKNTKKVQNIDAIKLLYLTLVRTKLEYCSLVWDPFYSCLFHERKDNSLNEFDDQSLTGNIYEVSDTQKTAPCNEIPVKFTTKPRGL